MPTKSAYVINVVGSPEYAAALEALRGKTGAPNMSELTDQALRQLARRHGIELPRRVRPIGANQHTSE